MTAAAERADAYRFLGGVEPVFLRLTRLYGQPDPFEWFDGGRTGASLFAAMVLHVTGQSISASAAFTVFDRLAAAAGGIPEAHALLALGPGRLRSLGLSGAKVKCLLELARRQAAGIIDVESMQALSDGEVIAALSAVPGIGQWSAQAFLMRQLRRPDVLPADDTGLRRAVTRQWHLEDLSTPRRIRDRAAAWAPYRSYAAALLWRSLRPVGEASDPKARALDSKHVPNFLWVIAHYECGEQTRRPMLPAKRQFQGSSNVDHTAADPRAKPLARPLGPVGGDRFPSQAV